MKLNKRLVLVLVVLLLVLNAINFTIITLTGSAIITGTTSLCFNNPPVIAAIANQSIGHNFLFTFQVNASDPRNESLLYADNTSLFGINNLTGLINFTPTLAQVRNYSVRISVSDYLTACPITRNADFNLGVYNLAPNFTSAIPNQAWNADVWLTGLNLSSYFSDPENDALFYTVRTGNNVSARISSAGVATIYPDSGWTG